jgi:hypothetical protein
VVWQALTADGNGVQVFDDDSYYVLMGGAAWLSNGTTSVHLNGTWYAAGEEAPSNSTGACLELQNVDCHGNDLYSFPSTDPSACCANCSLTPSCGAWTYTGTTEPAPPVRAGSGDGDAQAGALPPWAYTCYIKSNCDGKETYGGHTSGLPPGDSPAALQRLSAGAVNGSSPGIGAWSGWAIEYLAGAVRFTTTFQYYPAAQLFVLEQSFPDGASALNVTAYPSLNSTSSACISAGPGVGAVDGSTGRLRAAGSTSSNGELGEFCASTAPSTAFPALVPGPGAPADSSIGYATWAGRFAGTNLGGGLSNALGAAQGATGGPLVIFETVPGTIPSGGSVSRAGNTVVISSFNNHKVNILGASLLPDTPAGALAVGIAGTVTQVPAGYASATALFFSAAGVNDAMHGWGAALQAAYGTTRIASDPATTQLSYWTDNGE